MGRIKLIRFVGFAAWPLLRPAAWLYRRTVLRRRPVIAVSGSFGKTTTTRALCTLLGTAPPHWGNAYTFLALNLLRAPRGRAPAALEVGISRPRQMRSYARLLRPDVAVITAIGGEHVSSFGSVDRIAAEKGDLVAGVAPGGFVVLNGDDARVAALAERRSPGVRLVTVGSGPGHDYRAESVRLDWPHGTAFTLIGPGFQAAARVPLLGLHQLGCALAAAAVARELGAAVETIVERLAACQPPTGRLSRSLLPSGAWLLRDDFKSALPTIESALDVLAQIPARRRVVVMGDVGEPEGPQTPIYRALGARLGRSADRVLYMGNKFETLRQGARLEGPAAAVPTSHRDVQDIAATLERELEEGDVVLIKGRADQKLGRVALALHGGTVRCSLRSCHLTAFACEACPMLARGWSGLRPVT